MALTGVSEGWQRAAGAAFIVVVGAAVGGVLARSGQDSKDGVRFEVEFASAGALKTDARIRIAGHEVGEVRGMRRGADDHGAEGRHAIAECFVGRAWAEHLHRNSDYFIATPSILGEATLEIGPPRGGAEPGPLVKTGERVRGSDPPDLDRLLTRLYLSGTEIMLLARQHRGELDELFGAIESLVATASAIPVERGQLARIRAGAEHAIDETRAIANAIGDSHVAARAPALAQELSRSVERLRPEFADVAERAERAGERIEALRGFVSPAEIDAVLGTITRLGNAARQGQRIADDAQALAKKIEGGEGSVGGLMNDRELFDDLHETHRILKWQGWRLLLKRKPASTRPE